ncbi:MAG: ATP synthase F1 subunit gamma [Lachnospiraceae bacterium]|nr:ATP synthase F1 subunit gamma [Lachnospiraceae bacterium]
MASMKEIRMRIKSVDDIMKITNAMYLISSTKVKKARRSLDATTPYFNKMQDTILDILVHCGEDFSHKYFDERGEIPKEEHKRGYVIITGDKGLCGAYNHNVTKMAEQILSQHANSKLYVVGSVGRSYFVKRGYNVDEDFLYAAADPTFYRARSIAEEVVQAYETGELDEVYIIYTKMINSMASEPRMIPVLPLHRTDLEQRVQGEYQSYAVFSPSPEAVMDTVVPNYVKGIMYGAMVQAFCSEQNARMMAMQSATDSAEEIIADLNLSYNRARQAAITQEITEIVAGANSLKK